MISILFPVGGGGTAPPPDLSYGPATDEYSHHHMWYVLNNPQLQVSAHAAAKNNPDKMWQ